MEPALTIIRKLGGPSVVAVVVGVHRTRVSNWMRSKVKGGTGGNIPQKYHRALLELAHEKGLAVTADDFLPARDEDKASAA